MARAQQDMLASEGVAYAPQRSPLCFPFVKSNPVLLHAYTSSSSRGGFIFIFGYVHVNAELVGKCSARCPATFRHIQQRTKPDISVFYFQDRARALDQSKRYVCIASVRQFTLCSHKYSPGIYMATFPTFHFSVRNRCTRATSGTSYLMSTLYSWSVYG